jgi:hypothetical protein
VFRKTWTVHDAVVSGACSGASYSQWKLSHELPGQTLVTVADAGENEIAVQELIGRNSGTNGYK